MNDFIRHSAQFYPCIQTLFEEQVERIPDAVAVIYEEAQMTYRDLNTRANRLACYLRMHGVGPEVRVGICVERSLEMVLGLLAILKAGGAYVPLDPVYPFERLAFMLKDSQVAVLLTQEHLLARLPESDVCKVCLNRDWEHIALQSDMNGHNTITEENLAYVIYTSGSTGQPKGVAMPHRPLINLLHWQLQTSRLAPGAKTLQFTSLSFDVAFQEILATWCAGGLLYLINEQQRRNLLTLARLLVEEQVERLFLPFIVLQHLAEVCVAEQLWPESLREVNTAGEQLQITPALRTFFGKLPDCVLQNQYGPSETHVVTAYTLGKEVQAWDLLPPIGGAIVNTRVYLCDPHMHLVPVGVVGELYLGGRGSAQGYVARPDLTAERFIPDPFSGEPGARLYRTGDLARLLPDGNLEYLGRHDHQIKIRGFRVELGEIEAVLTQHPSVREAAVVVREDRPGVRRLVAYLVAEQLSVPSFRELRGYLQVRLPDYMLPSTFVLLEALPLTPVFKVDRYALPYVDEMEHEVEEVNLVPHTSTEQVIAAIWVKVLGQRYLTLHGSFFELGGDSLLAMQIVSRIQEAFRIEFPLQLFFDTPTIAGLVECVENTLQAGGQARTSLIAPLSLDGPFPLSVAQQRLWVLEHLAPGTTIYTIPLAFKLRGQLDTSALKQGLHEIVRRHQILHTSFAVVDGRPVQRMAAIPWPGLAEIDLRDRPAREREGEMRRCLKREVERLFDLNHGPLLRTHLLRLEEEEYVLFVSMHHLVSDGWSVEVFLHELAVLYHAYAQGRPSPLPELSIQYTDFAVWQHQWLQTERVENQLVYWKKQLAGVPALLSLPTDHPRPVIQTFRGATVHFTLTQRLTRSLEILSQQEHVTLFMTLLTVFQTLLFRYTGQTDIVVGTPVAGRAQRQTEELIGFFVNTLVLRTPLSGNLSFRQLLQRVRKVALEAYEHQDVPFEQLVEELGLERNLSYNPLFQVLFALQSTLGRIRALGDVPLKQIEIDRTVAQFDLSLEMTQGTDRLQGCFEYNTDLFESATITRMADHLQTLLEDLLRNPDQPIGAMLLLSEIERRQLLVEWNFTHRSFPEQCLHKLFEQQVERAPDVIALVYEDAQLTYDALNRRANQLAHYLRTCDVGPEVLVSLCMERSVEMVVGLLAVFKAGGAYIPLDPAYPTERLAYMLQDSQAAVLLTQEYLRTWLGVAVPSVVCVDTDWEHIAECSEANVQSGVKGENLAYVIYTSGSTGQPKGVLIEQKGLCNVAHAQAEVFQVQPESHILQFASLSFDAAIFEISLALLAGATLYLGTSESLQPGPILNRFLRVRAISVVTLTPSILKLLPSEELPQLRTIISAGERCLPEVIAEWGPGRQFFDAYGPTEATIWASVLECSSQVNGSIIGRPIANTQLYVLDQYLQPTPVGVPGELYIGGRGVTRGYIHRSDLTAERFLPDPFSAEPGARLYKTGDLVRHLPDGHLEFLRRVDHQVKIRGFRIEPREIEARLAQFPGVRECVVLARKDGASAKKDAQEGTAQGEKRLVAYVVSDPVQRLDSADMRHYLQAYLPSYEIPAAFILLEALPRTPNGKIDLAALPVPEWKGSVATYLAPRTPVERLLVDLWANILGIEPQRVGVHDNFFVLGGHSLLATQLVSLISTLLHVELPLRVIFEAPTIAEVALLLEEKQAERERHDLDTIQKVSLGNAERLLIDLDQLSEQEIDALFNTLDVEEK